MRHSSCTCHPLIRGQTRLVRSCHGGLFERAAAETQMLDLETPYGPACLLVSCTFWLPEAICHSTKAKSQLLQQCPRLKQGSDCVHQLTSNAIMVLLLWTLNVQAGIWTSVCRNESAMRLLDAAPLALYAKSGLNLTMLMSARSPHPRLFDDGGQTCPTYVETWLRVIL